MSRFEVDFSDEAIELLETLAHRQNCSKVEILRRAINLEKWFNDVTDSGARVIVEAKDGSSREIIKL